MKKRIVYIALLGLMAVSCSSYQKLLKNPDPETKYNAAKNYFQQKDYLKCSSLLEEIAPYYKGTSRSEELLYLMAEAYYGQKDYYSASEYYKTYVKTYPRGIYAQQSFFLIGYCFYLDSPDARLDQTSTESAIRSLSEFVELYPTSERVEEAYRLIGEMQDKLAYKGYLNARLYMNLGLYMGNNFRSAVITAQNVMKDYPETKYRENLLFVVLNAKYKEAQLSVQEKKAERYSEVIDEYYNYSNEFPNGKHIREANRMLKEAKQFVK